MILTPAREGAIEPRLTAEAAVRARRVEMILMDVDGVLTDGSIVFTGAAEELKSFDAQDGVAIRLARRAGLRVGLITGRKSAALERRASELKIRDLYMNWFHKEEAYRRILAEHRLADSEVAFIGDDLVDLPILKRVGFAATVPGARPEVIRVAHFVASLPGGRGAVRQILDFILKVQGRWERAGRGFL